METFPILEYDDTREALLEPSRLIRRIDIAEHCVICFFQEVITKLRDAGIARTVISQKSEIGQHPVYELELNARRVALFHPGVGAPLAAAFLDELIARGCRKFIVCGEAGVLNRELAVGHIVVPLSAVRDEGTSYHYLPPGREVQASRAGVEAIMRVLQKHRVEFVVGKTWTTDGIYRETPHKIQKRKGEGYLTVEMEAAALFAVAQFRGVALAQMLYGGDDVSGLEWDSRGWQEQTSVRERLFWLAAEACLEIEA